MVTTQGYFLQQNKQGAGTTIVTQTGLSYKEEDILCKGFGRHEHRWVMENILGRPLTSKEVVHHKDGNKHNNDPSNLEVMSRARHFNIHVRGEDYE